MYDQTNPSAEFEPHPGWLISALSPSVCDVWRHLSMVGRSAPLDMRVRPGRAVLASCGLKALFLLDACGRCEQEKRRPRASSSNPKPRFEQHAPCATQPSRRPRNLQRISSVGYALSAISDTPKRTPKKSWLLLEVLGCPWRISGRESSLENRTFGVYWMSVDVPGTLWTSLDGSPGRIRTSDQSVNSRTLYH